MISNVFKTSLLAMLGGAILPVCALADTVTQKQTFSYEGHFSGASGSTNFVDSSFFTGTFNPWTDYGPSNQLTSFTINWDVKVTVSAVAEATTNGILNTTGFSGNYFVNGAGYSGNGNGFGNGGPPSTVFPPQSITATESRTYNSASTGIDYPASVLTSIMTGPVVSWGTGFGMTYSGIASGDVTISGSLVLIYNGIESVPEPGTLALAGLGGLALAAFRRKQA